VEPSSPSPAAAPASANTESSGARADPPRIPWAFVIGIAALLTVLFGVQNFLATNQTAYVAFARQATIWGVWVAMTPWIIGTARRHPLEERPTWRWVWTQLAIGGWWVVVHAILGGTLRWLIGVAVSENLVEVLASNLVSNFARNYVSYWFIAATYQAVLYHRTVRERDAEAGRLQLALARARVESLESRLRPHFLFNTLNAIAALIRDDPGAAESMLGQLSDLLRASLAAEPGREVPLQQELDLVEQYLAIQRARFQDRLHTTVEATDAARRGLVPLLLLQPVVENAIVHGIAPRESGGGVSIRAEQRDGRLHMIVEDDGVGLGGAPRARAGSGIGLESVRARLLHLYGVAQRVELEPRWPSGTRVSIEVPYHTEPTSNVTDP